MSTSFYSVQTFAVLEERESITREAKKETNGKQTKQSAVSGATEKDVKSRRTTGNGRRKGKALCSEGRSEWERNKGAQGCGQGETMKRGRRKGETRTNKGEKQAEDRCGTLASGEKLQGFE